MTDCDNVPHNVGSDEQPTISPGVSYPIIVHYCGECTMPIEYCEYSGKTDRCRIWLEQNLPKALDEQLSVKKSEASTEKIVPEDDKKHQKRGGKGMSKSEKEKESKKPTKITLKTATRSKNKSVTIVKGLGSYGIESKTASKFFFLKSICLRLLSCWYR